MSNKATQQERDFAIVAAAQELRTQKLRKSAEEKQRDPAAAVPSEKDPRER
jgi:hypothetical protein